MVLATSNPGKLAEIRDLLESPQWQLVPQDALGIEPPPETGSTYLENALLKAHHAARASGLAAIADDSGLEVDCLGGRPGVRSARYAGDSADDRANIDKLLGELHGHSTAPPTARFRCISVWLRHAGDPAPVIAEGVWEGMILPAPRGRGGFGYDPVFFVPTHNCSAAELPAPVKNAISHRARAFSELAARLRIAQGREMSSDDIMDSGDDL